MKYSKALKILEGIIENHYPDFLRYQVPDGLVIRIATHVKQQVETIGKLEKEIVELKDEVVKKTKWYEIY